MPGKFPRAYINDVPNPDTVSGIEYVPFPTMGAGARRSGLPDRGSKGPGKIENIGGNALGRSK